MNDATSQCGFTTPAEHKTFALISGSTYPKQQEPTLNVIEDTEYERFNRFASATSMNLEPMFKVTATFVGRLDRRKNFKLGKNGWGNGFGADGASEYQFILHSVSEVDVEQAPPLGPQPIDSTLPDRIANEK